MPKDYYRFQFDTQYDLIELKNKILALKEEHEDKYGWQYVKDFV